MSDNHAAACRQYSMETIELIIRDLQKNTMTLKDGSWEQGRLEALRQEIKRRRKALE